MDDAASASRARRRAALAVHGGLVLALAAAYALLAPPSRWDDPVALLALGALAVVADRHDVPLPSGIRFDALVAVALIAVSVGGPLPALAVVLAPMLVNGLTGHETLWRAGNLANLAAYSGYVLAGSLVLALLPPGAAWTEQLGWLVVAGLVQGFVNWALGPAIYGPMWLGRPFADMLALLRDAIPTGTAMLLLGAGTVLATPALGLLALGSFALIAVLPQTALTFAARTSPVGALEPAAATRAYARALALQLGLDRPARRHLDAVLEAGEQRPPTGAPIDYALATMRDRSDATCHAQLVPERWDGSGGPLGLRAEAIPVPARIVAVASAWSALTARGGARLGHHEALEELQVAAGAGLDPRVVHAARAVVAQERVSAAEPAPEPRLHGLRIPAPLRRALAGS